MYHFRVQKACIFSLVCSAYFGMCVRRHLYASVEIYYMYKTESWYKLQGGHILIQITRLQDFGADMVVVGGGGGGGRGCVYFGVCLYSKYYSTRFLES